MSDSTANLDQVSQNAIQRETTINANFDAHSPSSIFGRRASTCSALTWGYYGGRLDGTSAANGTVALTGATTNYVVAHRTTLAVSTSTATTNWNDTATYGRCYKIVTGASSVTSHEDHRAGSGGILGGGSASGTTTLTGDVTGSGSGSFATTIATGVVTNAKLADVATATFKGRTTAGTGVPEDLTVTQATALLNAMVGDSGSGGTKGLAPAPASGDTAAGKFLKADGTWAVPAGSGSSAMQVLSPAYSGTLTVDLSSYTTYPIVVVNVGVLTGNITFNITNGTDGQIIRCRFEQDGTGGRTFTAGADLRFSTDTPSPTLSTAASAIDRLAFEWHAGDSKADLVAVNKGY